MHLVLGEIKCKVKGKHQDKKMLFDSGFISVYSFSLIYRINVTGNVRDSTGPVIVYFVRVFLSFLF